MAASRLPAEMLLSIFETDDEHDPVHWASVCSSWRRMALGCPSLWTTLNLKDSRPEWSEGRAALFLARAGKMPLKIVRSGLRKVWVTPRKSRYDPYDSPALVRLDTRCLALLPRCQEFTYEEIYRRDDEEAATAFLTSVITSPAPALELLNLAGPQMPPQVIHLKLQDELAARCVTAGNFPRLRRLETWHMCLPFFVFATPSLSTICINTDCIVDDYGDDRCQHALGGLQPHLLPLLNACVDLRYMALDFADTVPGNENHPYEVPDGLDVLDVLKRTLIDAVFNNLPLVWPSDSRLRTESPWPILRNLFFEGYHTQPAYELDNSWSSIAPVLHLLAHMPNLKYLYIRNWTTPPHESAHENLPSVLMPCLTRLELEGTLGAIGRPLISALQTPVLEELKEDFDSVEGDADSVDVDADSVDGDANSVDRDADSEDE